MKILFGCLRFILIIIGIIAIVLIFYGTYVFILFIYKQIKSKTFISELKKYIKKKAKNKILKIMEKELENEKNDDLLEEKFKQLKEIDYSHDLIIQKLKNYSKNQRVNLKTHSAGLLDKKGIPVLLDVVKSSLINKENNYTALRYLADMEKKYEHQIIDGYIKILKSDNLNLNAKEDFEDNKISNVLDQLIYKNYDKTKKFLIDFFKLNKKAIDKSNYIKRTFLYFFKFHKIKDYYNWVLKQLNTEDIYTKETAVSCVEEIGDINAVKHLYLLLKSGNVPIGLKREIAKIIKKFQKDIPVTNKGNLALVEEYSEGNLSISENKDGKLSINK